ncbi:MAG TPA: MAPEG family protein [Steroidobacteraceae bacterium]|nr:MAPEG family protein [Steroidobacteraceae bacterium]
MTLELHYLVLVTALTAVLWVPYILNRIAVRGLVEAVGYPENPKPGAPWAERMQAAHANAVENLAVFAALVLVAHLAGVSSEGTVLACQVYFWARLVHVIAYTLALPWVRTIAFFAGFASQATLAWLLLA